MRFPVRGILILFVLASCQSPAAPPKDRDGEAVRAFRIGTNLKELRDWGRELPFVDLMHNARVWFSQDVGNPSAAWNSEAADLLAYRPDGYPTEVPQTVAGQAYPQKVVTIWADVSGWPEGTYTVLFDGTGSLSVGGSVAQVTRTGAHRMTFVLNRTWSPPSVQLAIDSSEAADPVRAIRVLMPGTEATSSTQPFNPAWLDKVRKFASVRFMDWGDTNSWGWALYPKRPAGAPFRWEDRQRMDAYTWTDGRGVPYEMMVRLMNDQGLDGWVCVPDRADEGFVQAMAALFHDGLDPRRKLTVEYSNEIWNSMMGQSAFLTQFGHPSAQALANHRDHPQNYPRDPATTWPEKLTGNIQDCLDTWTSVWGVDLPRLTRVVGLQTGWPDVSRRIAFNLRPGSYDAVAPSCYFGLGPEFDATLDALGASATLADVARMTRESWDKYDKPWLREIRSTVAVPLGVPMVFYEGGQGLTPTPFGQEPTYAQALVDIQRAPVIEDLYREWFQFLLTLRTGDQPLSVMHFSLVGGRSAAYGSWGTWEFVDQDTTQIPAPKADALREIMTW
jgi:hypothetical protein